MVLSGFNPFPRETGSRPQMKVERGKGTEACLFPIMMVSFQTQAEATAVGIFPWPVLVRL